MKTSRVEARLFKQRGRTDTGTSVAAVRGLASVGMLMGLLMLLAACGGGQQALNPGMEATSLVVVNGTGAQELDGMTVAGTITIRPESSDNVRAIDYFIDSPEMSEDPFAHVANKPFELVLDTTQLANGEHRVTAAAWNADDTGIRIIGNSTFTVQNSDAGEPGGTPGEGSEQSHTLLGSFQVVKEIGGNERPDLADIRYRLRQFDADPYRGWDLLTNLPAGSFLEYTRSDWLRFTLNREATVVVLTDGYETSWLSSWEEGPEVDGDRSFTKVFPAGEVVLGSIEGRGSPYEVLLGEASGQPSPVPDAPSGLPTPQANEYCPTWVHDQYVTEGPDGATYATWHPQVDPTYWCYFGHEHGSDPANFAGDILPTYNYYADKGGRDEPHESFKTWVINDAGKSIMVTVHMGSSSGHRVCTRIHTLDIAAADLVTGELLANFKVKGDFGFTRAVNGGRNHRLHSSDCPEMSSLMAADTEGRINIPLFENFGYEPWQPGSLPTLGMSNLLTFVIDDPVTKLDVERDGSGNPIVDSDGYYTYAGVVDTGSAGFRRWGTVPNSQRGGKFTISAADALAEGHFCTDYVASKLLDCSDPMAVEQYIKPGLHFEYGHGDKLATRDAWGMLYERKPGDPWRFDMNIGGALTKPN